MDCATTESKPGEATIGSGTGELSGILIETKRDTDEQVERHGRMSAPKHLFYWRGHSSMSLPPICRRVPPISSVIMIRLTQGGDTAKNSAAR